MRTRKAQPRDAKSIHQLIDSFTHDGTLLPRSHSEICENIGTFTVIESEAGQFIGCAALHVYGTHLAEVRSIVVRPDIAGHGAGSLLVQSLLRQAEQRGIQCVCLFTRIPTFFEHFRFRITQHQSFRDKALKDCQHCARRNACDEIAMALGKLPPLHNAASIDSMHHPQPGLVQLQL